MEPGRHLSRPDLRRRFLDTNILIYADDHSTSEKRSIARQILDEALTTGRGVLSTQILQEFYVVSTRKLWVGPAVVRRKVELSHEWMLFTLTSR